MDHVDGGPAGDPRELDGAPAEVGDGVGDAPREPLAGRTAAAVGDGDDVDALVGERDREPVDVDRCSAGPAQREAGVEEYTHHWGSAGTGSAGGAGEQRLTAALDPGRLESGILEEEGEGVGGEEAEMVGAGVEV
jgi:hypothetical protein